MPHFESTDHFEFNATFSAEHADAQLGYRQSLGVAPVTAPDPTAVADDDDETAPVPEETGVTDDESDINGDSGRDDEAAPGEPTEGDTTGSDGTDNDGRDDEGENQGEGGGDGSASTMLDIEWPFEPGVILGDLNAIFADGFESGDAVCIGSPRLSGDLAEKDGMKVDAAAEAEALGIWDWYTNPLGIALDGAERTRADGLMIDIYNEPFAEGIGFGDMTPGGLSPEDVFGV